jgi:hypothetical protein
LSVVPPIRTRAPRAPFVALVGLLLTAGLGALLFLHTALAEESFYLHDLKARSLALSEREQALEQEVAYAASPQRLALRARALGMVRSENPAFIRTADGRILGVPKAGVRPPPKPKPKASTPAGATPTPAPGAQPTREKKKAGAQQGATPTPTGSR